MMLDVAWSSHICDALLDSTVFASPATRMVCAPVCDTSFLATELKSPVTVTDVAPMFCNTTSSEPVMVTGALGVAESRVTVLLQPLMATLLTLTVSVASCTPSTLFSRPGGQAAAAAHAASASSSAARSTARAAVSVGACGFARTSAHLPLLWRCL
jgi:hypothetical protein